MSSKANQTAKRGDKTEPVGNVKRASLDRSAWISEARDALIEGGIAAVKVGKLAAKLDVTRESFYWHFKNLQELLDELLKLWSNSIAAAYEALLDPQHDGAREFLAMVDMHLDATRFDPAWESAMRDWGRISPTVEHEVRRVDAWIVEMIKQMFMDMGCENIEALVRARITHFHQVGYYKINPGETREERLRLLPVYVHLLTGRSLLE